MKLFNRVSRRIRSREPETAASPFEFRLVRGTPTADDFHRQQQRRIHPDRRARRPLRQAIDDSNATPGPDTIDFNIPGPGPVIIQPSSPRCRRSPTRSTWMGPPNALSSAYLPPALHHPAQRQRATGRRPGPGVHATEPIGWRNQLGRQHDYRAGHLQLYGGAGIHIQTNGNLVTGNFFGTDVNGTAAGPGNGNGVVIDSTASNNTIGGTGAGAGNVISGNSGDGIDISGDGNFVQGNKIGTDVVGSSSLGNQVAGVRILGSFNTIGGTGSGAGNVISGSKDEGIFVDGRVTTRC